jgi:hypothetical protein
MVASMTVRIQYSKEFIMTALPGNHFRSIADRVIDKEFSGGSILEFGVAGGITFTYQAVKIEKSGKPFQLIGFDSWKGLPEETSGVWRPDRHHKGVFSYPKSEVIDHLVASVPDYPHYWIRFIDGFYSESLTKDVRDSIGDEVVFLNIDVDIHSSTMQLLDWVTPILKAGALMYYDDWKDPIDTKFHVEAGNPETEWGEHLAHKQWLDKNPGFEVKELCRSDLDQPLFQVVKSPNGVLNSLIEPYRSRLLRS